MPRPIRPHGLSGPEVGEVGIVHIHDSRSPRANGSIRIIKTPPTRHNRNGGAAASPPAIGLACRRRTLPRRNAPSHGSRTPSPSLFRSRAPQADLARSLPKILSPRVRQIWLLRMKSAVRRNGCAIPSGFGWMTYSKEQNHWLPFPTEFAVCHIFRGADSDFTNPRQHETDMGSSSSVCYIPATTAY